MGEARGSPPLRDRVVMTKQRSLKKLVRERMQRTGETYTTAHRVITSKRPERRPPGLLPSYPEAGYAVHRESALVQRLLTSAGLELSEALVCGLGGGIGFMYAVFEYKALPHPLLTFVAQHHPRPWIEQVAENLGLELRSATSSSAKPALAKLDAALEAGQPALITVGRGGLPWFSDVNPIEAADPYNIGVVGKHGDDYLIDDCSESVQVAPAAALADAWGLYRKARFAVQTLALPSGGHNDMTEALRAAIATTVAHMTGPVLGNSFDVNFGLSGIAKWADELADDRTKKGWQARFGQGPGFEHAVARIAECFTHAYSAPGATRPIYARFLEEADSTSSLPLGPAAKIAAESGNLWEEVVEVAVKAQDPGTTFAAIGDLARRLHEVESRLAQTLGRAVET